MCGIIAYKGEKNASEIVLEGLKNLEYRGYDSWGIAGFSGSEIDLVKSVGKISEARSAGLPSGTVAIGHTRWSTHGTVTKANAHPHLDCKGRIAVVHNGIVENYQELKKLLGSHKFSSDTDTEVIPHMIEEKMNGMSFEKAVTEVSRQINGRSAFVAINSGTDEIIAVRKGTPLIVGTGEKEFFIASDINAFLKHTRLVQYLDDNEMVVIGTAARFLNLETGETLNKRVIEISWKPEEAKKDGYMHFLIKEIMEQKDTLWRAINQDESRITSVAADINAAYGTFLVGCGTAGKVCMAGEYLFSKVANKHVNAYVASEFPNYSNYLTPKSLIIAISQSGETGDVLDAIDSAKKKGSKVISLLNVFGSTMMRASDEYFMVNAGMERAVVSTKATTAQLAVITLLAYAAAGKLQEGKRLLISVAESVNDMLNPRYEERIKGLAGKLKDKNDVYIIGRSLNYPIALEAAIKLQESAYVHAQGFAGGELKHGPLALIEKGTPCIALVANDEVKEETISNASEIRSRGGYIIGIAPENNEVFDYWIKVPDAGNASPIVNVIPIQMLAYHLALQKGVNPDYPRNLAKVITTK